MIVYIHGASATAESFTHIRQFVKNKYKKLNKTYQFYIIPGIQTNTDDPLGIITKNQLNQLNQVKVIAAQ